MSLADTARTLLAAFVTQLEAQDVEVPARQYVAPGGLVAQDGEQLVLVLRQISQGQPGKPEAATFVPGSEILAAQFAVSLLRSVPALHGEGFTGSMIPDGIDLGESGLQTVADAEALIKAAMEIHADHTVTEAALQGFSVGPLVPVGPEGGLAGSQLTVEINLG